MSDLGSIFGGGAEHAHKQAELEKILPAPAPIAGDGESGKAEVPGVSIPEIGLPGQAMAYKPFGLEEPKDDSEE